MTVHCSVIQEDEFSIILILLNTPENNTTHHKSVILHLKSMEEFAASRSAEIDGLIEARKKESTDKIKILLLGPGEAGKSTILKQMQMLYKGGFSDADRAAYTRIIHNNILKGFHKLSSCLQYFLIQIILLWLFS